MIGKGEWGGWLIQTEENGSYTTKDQKEKGNLRNLDPDWQVVPDRSKQEPWKL